MLFLGNFVKLKHELERFLEGDSPSKFVILDFHQVPYIERSVWEALAQLDKKAKEREINFVLCGLTTEVKKEMSIFAEDLKLTRMTVTRSLQLAMQHAEDEILSMASPSNIKDIYAQLGKMLVQHGHVLDKGGQRSPWPKDELSKFFELLHPADEEMICERGEEATAIYYVGGGEFHVFNQYQSSSGERRFHLLRKLESDFFFGSEALTMNPTYRAWVQCKVSGPVLQLKVTSLKAMNESKPMMAQDMLCTIADARIELCWQLMEHNIQPERIPAVIHESGPKQTSLRRSFTTVAEEMLDVQAQRQAPTTRVASALRGMLRGRETEMPALASSSSHASQA